MRGRSNERNPSRSTDIEAIQVRFHPDRLPYAQLLDLYFRMHDPTTEGRQGPDVGHQYTSAIFVHDDAQREVAQSLIEKIQAAGWWGKDPIVTQVLDAKQWWDAEEYHQKYLAKNPEGYECPTHFVRDFPAVKL